MVTATARSTCLICDASLPRGNVPTPCARCGFTLLTQSGNVSYDYDAEYDERASYNALPPAAILDHYRNAPNTGWALAKLRELRRAEGLCTLREFGSSQGGFLALARDEGYSVRGVELSTTSVSYGHERLGLKEQLELGRWRARDGDTAVDVVCAFEVLEHTEDPLETLSIWGSWVRPRGYLMLSVPNGRRLNVRAGRREPQDQPPHHLMYWTKDSLDRAIRRSGFEPLELFTSRVTHSDLANLVAPSVQAARAAELGSVRPVGSEAEAPRRTPSFLRLAYPALIAGGKLAARVVNRIPELGSRLMVLARRNR